MLGEVLRSIPGGAAWGANVAVGCRLGRSSLAVLDTAHSPGGTPALPGPRKLQPLQQGQAELGAGGSIPPYLNAAVPVLTAFALGVFRQ